MSVVQYRLLKGRHIPEQALDRYNDAGKEKDQVKKSLQQPLYFIWRN